MKKRILAVLLCLGISQITLTSAHRENQDAKALREQIDRLESERKTFLKSFGQGFNHGYLGTLTAFVGLSLSAYVIGRVSGIIEHGNGYIRIRIPQ